eukprot:CAMPEP_0194296864 /NCGR_PEP_ID=MMETSP0169-20130528/57363_1 /TAXON_ID=218684 /ORGANISM="Corethron pennatum, Strain L29A3" /LENGTH=823 /DNA_ID=CAMNT_0039046483 /DNA_START=119 /DNA_END=2590 /DNA_ORIENTATION=+
MRKGPLTQKDYRAVINGTAIKSEDVATLPRPGTSAPSSIKFHGNSVTYLAPAAGGSLSRNLWATDLTTGETRALFQSGDLGREEDFSPEEKLRRERTRMMATGVTSYAWASKADRMLVPIGGALYVLDNPLRAGGADPRKIAETGAGDGDGDGEFDALPAGAPLLDAKISEDGTTVAFVTGNEVYVVATAEGEHKPRRLTSGARGLDGMTNGVADYLAQEELERADGFWLSPGGGLVAYESVDESHIPSYRITHQGEDKGLSPTLEEGMSTRDVEDASKVTYEEHRFCFAGASNPIVKFGVVDTAATGKRETLWFDLSIFGDDFYLAKVEWLPRGSKDADANRLVVQLLDRRQKNLALVMLDCVTGGATTLHVEKATEGTWINLNDSFRLISRTTDGESLQFLWASERDGYRHLYVLEASLAEGGKSNTEDGGAKVVRRLTGPGEFVVEEVLTMDHGKGLLYYMGTEQGRWLERHLFRVSLDGSGAPQCLTGAVPGQHSCVLNTSVGLFVDTVSSITSAPVATVCRIPAASVTGDVSVTPETVLKLHDAAESDARVAALGDALKPPTFHTFPSTDKKVTLQAALYLPDEKTHGKGPYPLLVATYGGPHVQYVQNTWGMMTADMRSQFLRANGFAVLKVDNRGSSRRGLVFEAPIFGNMGELEVADQVAGVEWAVGEGVADARRVSVSGWSYGGYMALKCISGRPDVFHAAVSGAPVTDWTLYDTAYTERYMGLPQENPNGYKRASALANVADIDGSLLLCHGLLDENVLFRQSAILINELIKHQKAYDLALFPSERHGPRRSQDRAFLEERILAFLQRSLGIE